MARDLARTAERLEADPAELQRLESRLALLQKLNRDTQKARFPSLSPLPPHPLNLSTYPHNPRSPNSTNHTTRSATPTTPTLTTCYVP